MRLLLDEMFPAAIAEQLRPEYDVAAVHERLELREASDDTVFAVAQSERRAVVTENVSDFMPFDASAHAAGKPHFGLVFTTNRSLPRHRKAFIGEAVRRLGALCREHPEDQASSLVLWL